MDKLKMHSPDLSQDNISKIRAFFPNCVTEVKDDNDNLKLAIDFEQLKQELSDSIVDGTQEKYQLNWPGKRAALITANSPVTKTLRPKVEESVDFYNTKNLFIEGDNLIALKLLQENYLEKIKVIYIDPPYNTGSDFIYKDSFKSKTGDFLNATNQIDASGQRLVANTSSNGRFHSDWLSMIYSRLRLAKNLLSDDGIIFISIDDEIANLKKVCDEVFGEKNFIDIFSWQKTTTPPNLSSKTKKSCEYIIAFQKQECGTLKGLIKESKSSNGLMNQTNPVGTLQFPPFLTKTKLEDGVYKSGAYGTPSYKIELLEDTHVLNGEFIHPIVLKGKFKWSQSYLDQSIKEGVKIFIQTLAFSPSYEKENYDPEKPWNIINNSFGVGTNENASDELDSLFDKNFSEKIYPKPTSLLKYLINTNVKDNDIVMDFFAGSGSTADAVMQLNAELGLNLSFITIQLDEDVNKKTEAFNFGFKKISEITKERIRRSGNKLLKTETHKTWNKDVGFRVLKIDDSNMTETYYNSSQTNQNEMFAHVETIKKGRSALDLLFQVMLDWGIDLSKPLVKSQILSEEIYSLNANENGEGADLIACFSNNISGDLVSKLAALHPLRVVFRDDGFETDSVKINAEQIFLQKSPITEVKSI